MSLQETKEKTTMQSAQVPLTILSPVASYRHPMNMSAIGMVSADSFFMVRLFECFGVSEVARARNRVASQAVASIRKTGGLVLWLDADMTCDPTIVQLHAHAVMASGRAISGRAVMRQDETKVAASLKEHEEREEESHEFEFQKNPLKMKLTPVLAGLGCLMMTAKQFLAQLDASPVCKMPDRDEENLVCCPRIEEHEKFGNVFISEDHCYSLAIEGGAWMAEIETETGEGYWLDYGHIAERVLVHAPKASKIDRGSYK